MLFSPVAVVVLEISEKDIDKLVSHWASAEKDQVALFLNLKWLQILANFQIKNVQLVYLDVDLESRSGNILFKNVKLFMMKRKFVEKNVL